MANREQECTDAPVLEDEHGEYVLDRGSTTPTEGKCNAVLRSTWSRFGERRYCQMPQGWRNTDNDSEFCRWHSERKYLRDHVMEKRLTHGAYVESYRRLLNVMPLHKKVTVIALFKSLREESVHDFDGEDGPETYEVEVDASDVSWYSDDEAIIDIPIAQGEKRTREKALLKAACEFVKMESIDEQIFEDAFDADETGLGEKEFVVDVTESGETITAEDEHHLNPPVSRMMKDFKDCMAFGGVAMNPDGDDEQEDVTVDARSFNVDLGPREEDAVAPEAQVDEKDRIEIKEPNEVDE
jgi:hypothetical protein